MDRSKRGKHLNRNSKNSNETKKNPFDKKKWRLQKYSRKYKLDQFEQKRQTSIKRAYYKKTLKREQYQPKIDVQKIYEQYASEEESDTENATNKPKKKLKTNVRNAKLEFERMKSEKEMKRQTLQKQKEERQIALAEYEKKKQQKAKILKQKTRKGQPVMKGRIEMLLNQIQTG